MNAAVSAENQGLQHDNKQLNTLIKEYEQTLETLMSAFRTRAVSLHCMVCVCKLMFRSFSVMCKNMNFHSFATTKRNYWCKKRKMQHRSW
jgi:hypothetical protein